MKLLDCKATPGQPGLGGLTAQASLTNNALVTRLAGLIRRRFVARTLHVRAV
jgi:hypothetical protein